MAFASPLRLLKVDFEMPEAGGAPKHLVIFSAITPTGIMEITIPIEVNTVFDEELVMMAQTRCHQFLQQIASETQLSVTMTQR